MSQAELIKKGMIAEKRLARSKAQADAKTALRTLSADATYAWNKPVEEIDTAGLMLHLEQLTAKQEEVRRLDAEIRELEY